MMLLALLALPFAAGVLSAMARRRSQMEAINVAGFAATFLLAIAIAAEVLRAGTVSLWDGFLYADALSALIILLNSAVALICSIYAVGYLREGNGGDLALMRKYYVLTPLFVGAMLLVTIANSLGVMWAAIELTTLASVFLVTFYGKDTSLEAAWKYAIIGSVGLSMALFATIVTFYAGHKLPGADSVAGLNWSALAQQASRLDPTSMRMAFVLALLGYGAKAGLAPMHTWKPDVYSEAPAPTAAILSTAMLNCAIYGLIRFYVLTSRCLGSEYPGGLLLLLGIFSMGITVPFVLVQKNLKRLLAYSTIDHAGIMAAALGIGGKLATLGLMLHMTFHSVAKPLLFFCAGNIGQRFKTDRLQLLKGGMIQVMPVTGVALFVGMLAIVGLPPLSLFQSEFLIAGAAFGGAHSVSGALFIFFGAGLFAGMALHVSRLVLGPSEDARSPVYPWREGAVVALTAVLVVIAFWLPRPLLELIRRAATVVTG
jgi:hydrogenase-4 component F